MAITAIVDMPDAYPPGAFRTRRRVSPFRGPGWGPKLDQMTKKRTAWVLDTETKGTGAEMVPLERLEKRKRLQGERERIRVVAQKPDPGERCTEPEAPRAPRRFRVMDVLSRELLADDAGINEALQALRTVGSVVDANIYVWEPTDEDWRPLTLSERRRLWNLRSAEGSADPSAQARR